MLTSETLLLTVKKELMKTTAESPQQFLTRSFQSVAYLAVCLNR
jgi:hypothetical protein